MNLLVLAQSLGVVLPAAAELAGPDAPDSFARGEAVVLRPDLDANRGVIHQQIPEHESIKTTIDIHLNSVFILVDLGGVAEPRDVMTQQRRRRRQVMPFPAFNVVSHEVCRETFGPVGHRRVLVGVAAEDEQQVVHKDHRMKILGLTTRLENPPESPEWIELVKDIHQVGRSRLFTDQSTMDENQLFGGDVCRGMAIATLDKGAADPRQRPRPRLQVELLNVVDVTVNGRMSEDDDESVVDDDGCVSRHRQGRRRRRAEGRVRRPRHQRPAGIAQIEFPHVSGDDGTVDDPAEDVDVEVVQIRRVSITRGRLEAFARRTSRHDPGGCIAVLQINDRKKRRVWNLIQGSPTNDVKKGIH